MLNFNIECEDTLQGSVGLLSRRGVETSDRCKWRTNVAESSKVLLRPDNWLC